MSHKFPFWGHPSSIFDRSNIDPEEWPTPAPTSTPPASAQTNTDYSPSSKESTPAVSPPPSHTDGVHQHSPPPPRNLFYSATAPSPYNARQMPSSPDPSSPLAADSPHIHRPPSNPVDSSSPNFTTQSPVAEKETESSVHGIQKFLDPLDIIKLVSNPDIPQYENAPPGLKENTAFLVKDLHNTERQKWQSLNIL